MYEIFSIVCNKMWHLLLRNTYYPLHINNFVHPLHCKLQTHANIFIWSATASHQVMDMFFFCFKDISIVSFHQELLVSVILGERVSAKSKNIYDFSFLLIEKVWRVKSWQHILQEIVNVYEFLWDLRGVLKSSKKGGFVTEFLYGKKVITICENVVF